MAFIIRTAQVMDSSNLGGNVCRICLQHNAMLNWDCEILEFHGMTYKDCYYKYTRLEESDSDCFPTNLCEICSNDLKNAHMLFEKALESFSILHAALTSKTLKTEYSDMEICNSQPTQCEMHAFDESDSMQCAEDNSSTDYKTLIEIENEICLSNIYGNGSLAEAENTNNSKEISISEYVTIEPAHFIDIQNFEQSAEEQLGGSRDAEIKSSGKVRTGKRKKKSIPETSLERQHSEMCASDLPKLLTIKKSVKTKKCESVTQTLEHTFSEPSAEEQLSESHDTEIKSAGLVRTGKKRKTYKSLPDTSLEQEVSESCESELPKLYPTKKGVKTKKCVSLAQTLLEENFNANCDIKASATSTNQAGKAKKKNPLMCAYCSLWVDGNTQLKLHESTHSEDRKRTEICPQCGIKLYTKVALNCHMKIHDENREKRYKCEFCEKAFFNRGGLNIHRRIHLGLMVKCPICSKEFYRQVDLNRHLPKHSATPLQKSAQQLKYTVQCQYCNEHVRTDKWKGHKAAHLDQPQVKCKICEKNFFARSKCVKHLQRLHKKKKGYAEFIHYYVVQNARLSHLMIKQQEIVKPLE